MATPDRLTSEQLKVSGLRAGALKRSAPQSYGYGYVCMDASNLSSFLQAGAVGAGIGGS